MKKTTLHIFTTGGTIEKSYHEIEGSLLNRESVINKSLISTLRLPYLEIQVHEIMAKDSLFLTLEDRLKIWNTVESYFSQNAPMIVLHGTDTMEQTAQLFYEKNPTPPAPIVFTGAMIPMGFIDSDAKQNFTEALMAAQIAPPGVYVSFHGHLFHVPNCQKNLALRTFEEKVKTEK